MAVGERFGQCPARIKNPKSFFAVQLLLLCVRGIEGHETFYIIPEL